METTQLARGRIIVALDLDTREEAIDLVRKLRDHVGLFKVGLELLTSEGIDIVKEIADLGGKILLDGKFNDIPNTVAGASRAVTRLGISMFTVHTMGGSEMMQAAVQAAGEEASRLCVQRPLVLGVTLLTSIDQATATAQLRIPGDVESHVVHLAGLADHAELDGVIASPWEIEAIRNSTPSRMLVVTPGVRPSWAAAQDQRRIMTPGEAISRGSTYLVVGRPIVKPPPEIGTPVDAARRVAEEMASALASVATGGHPGQMRGPG